MAHTVPEQRIQKANRANVNPHGHYVLYWMTACRRVHWNFSLDRALEWSAELNKPLVILEALRCGYQWASDRLHHFILTGMVDNANALKGRNVLYYPYLEPKEDADKGLLETLSTNACVVVTDDFPAFFLPRMLKAAAEKITVCLEKVDANGLFPLGATDRIFTTAYAFRRFLQKMLPPHLKELPNPFPFKDRPIPVLKTLPASILEKWPALFLKDVKSIFETLPRLPIDHSVDPVSDQGGAVRALETFQHFLKDSLCRYREDRNKPDVEAASGLSPYLHFGHISAHQVFHEIAQQEKWSVEQLTEKKAAGKREGWWGMDSNSEAFLDQLITWRELGFNLCRHSRNYHQYESLSKWALDTLNAHSNDERPYLYSLEILENARTHDPLWNAAQNQLVREGRIHNYLRMLWGKKILHWTASPKEALNIMIHLNNRYALDGRDPNSYSGIFWVMGRYDRAWGPERTVFGKIRYMSSKNTSRKIDTREYIKKYGANTIEGQDGKP